MTNRYFQLLTKARRNAKRDYAAWAVVELDHEESRRLYCVPLDYCDYDDFVAFDGVLITIVWADGEVEQCHTRTV